MYVRIRIVHFEPSHLQWLLNPRRIHPAIALFNQSDFSLNQSDFFPNLASRHACYEGEGVRMSTSCTGVGAYSFR